MPDQNPQFVQQRLFADPTPHGIVNQRIIQHSFLLARQLTDLNEKEQQDLLHVLLYLGRKLAFTWNHLSRFGEIQGGLRRQVEATPASASVVIQIEYSEELFQEFDEFAVQLKSTLDHLVKIGVPVFGAKWTLRTFGDKGASVIKALENNVPKKHKAEVEGIKEMFLKRNETWLRDFIEVRDRVNHFVEGGLPLEKFGVNRLPDGSITVPMWHVNQPVVDAMDIIWNNLLRFSEDFVAAFLYFRRKPGLVLFHGPEPDDPTRSPWVVTTEEVMQRELSANPDKWRKP